MKNIRTLFAALGCLCLLTTALHAQVPQIVNYQGRVAVGTTNFNGTGAFKFALVNAAGTTTFWSNDGTSTAGSQPTAAVSLTVTKGLYSVLLGDTTLVNMTAIPASVFANADVRLRVWFNDGANGSQLVSPDQGLAAVGYALMAARLPSVTSNASGASVAGSLVINDPASLGAITISENGDYTPKLGSDTNLTLEAGGGANLTLEAGGGANLDFNTAPNLAMRIKANGNVGIRTNNPATTLHTLGNGNDLPAISGSTQSAGHVARFQGGGGSGAVLDIGANLGDGFWIQSCDQSNLAVNYPLRLNPNGGGVAIGLTGAANTAALTVFGVGTPRTYSTSWIYDNIGGTPGNSGLTWSISILAQAQINAQRFIASSDARIKHVEGRSDSIHDLATIMGIEVTDFTYIDTIISGTGKQKKVIAQQVEKIFPEAVNRHTNVVPDIYQKATVQDGWVTLATDLKVGERVRLIGEKKEEDGIHDVLEVREGAFRTAFQPATEKIFVYGREVKDFRSVDYEAIAMLNVSATQELARRLAAKDTELTRLSAENAAMKKQLAAQATALNVQATALKHLAADQAARDRALEARLARMEQAAPEATGVPVKVALTK